VGKNREKEKKGNKYVGKKGKKEKWEKRI